MSHHYSGPDFTCPHDDARLDFCDLFAFPKPEDSSRSILIMDLHPSVRLRARHLDEREGDGGQGGTTRGLPLRVPLPRSAT